MSSKQGVVGSIVSLWRYPVKSMLGEELIAAEVTQGGLLGDRAYGLIDGSDGKVATAKNPRKWPELFGFHAALGATAAPVRITLPDGTAVTSDQPDIHQILSKALQREIRLESAAHSSPAGVSEQYWPDMEGRDHRDTVTDFAPSAAASCSGLTLSGSRAAIPPWEDSTSSAPSSMSRSSASLSAGLKSTR